MVNTLTEEYRKVLTENDKARIKQAKVMFMSIWNIRMYAYESDIQNLAIFFCVPMVHNI